MEKRGAISSLCWLWHLLGGNVAGLRGEEKHPEKDGEQTDDEHERCKPLETLLKLMEEDTSTNDAESDPHHLKDRYDKQDVVQP